MPEFSIGRAIKNEKHRMAYSLLLESVDEKNREHPTEVKEVATTETVPPMTGIHFPAGSHPEPRRTFSGCVQRGFSGGPILAFPGSVVTIDGKARQELRRSSTFPRASLPAAGAKLLLEHLQVSPQPAYPCT